MADASIPSFETYEEDDPISAARSEDIKRVAK
jgi:hypothetical protein